MSRMRRNVVFLSPTPPPSRVKRSFELQVELSEKKLSSISSGFSRICQPQLPNRKFPAAAGDSLVFCKQYPARNPSKCPAVQPMSSLNVARLKGRWYEVAASSAHKFTAELGAACTAFEFEVAPKQNGLNAMRVTRRLVEAVGPVRATQVGTIASASLRSARNLRGVCSAIAGQKLPTELSYASLVNQAKLGLPAAGLDGKTAGQTSTSLSVISASLGQISAQAGAIHARLARIQTDLAPVNQVDRLPSLSALRSRIGNTTEAIRRSVRAIQRSRGRILKQADAVGRYEPPGVRCGHASRARHSHLLSLRALAPPSPQLLNATLALQRQASAVGTLAVSAAKIGLLSSLATPAAATLFESPVNLTQAVSMRGTLVQGKQGDGSIAMKFGGDAAVRYSVVHATPGFDLVVLYGCSAANRAKLAATEGQAKVLVLARHRTGSASELSSVEAVLQARGVVLGGAANVLVTTDQSCLSSHVCLLPPTHPAGQVLSGAVLSGAVLSGAVLSGAVLSGAVLSGAVLSGAVLSGAVLSGAVLSGAVLSGAVLSGAVLSGAVLSGAECLQL
ncbi:unnamed protein product [Closterium sp. Yama58-4]|nr:unnamed protein product [Closterium sp. Yama58-4]